MNKLSKTAKRQSEDKKKASIEVKYQESPIERALRLSSEQALALAIRDLLKRDELN